MFKSKALFFSLVLLFLTGSLFFFLFLTSDSHQALYQQIISPESKNGRTHGYRMKQLRHGVKKHFVYTKGPERFQIKLASRSSELELKQEGSDVQVVEHFKDLRCIMQEGFIYSLNDEKELKLSNGKLFLAGMNESDPQSMVPFDHPQLICKQVIRQLDARQATYHYKTEDLFAKQVKLMRFVALGNQLSARQPIESLMAGTAKQVECSLADCQKPFKAHGFRLMINQIKKKKI